MAKRDPAAAAEALTGALPVVGAVLGPLVGATFRTWLQKRAEEAQSALLSELARSNMTMDDVVSRDEGCAAIARFVRAVQEGRARENLKMMARAIAGYVRHPLLGQDEFLSFLDVAASLGREEIGFLGALYDLETNGVLEGLDDAERRVKRYTKIVETCVGERRLFTTEAELGAVLLSLVRTRLILVVSAMGTTALGGLYVEPSPLLARFVDLALSQDGM